MSREKPILFDGPMVRAILDGRKTQTRRLVGLRYFAPSDTPGYAWMFRGIAPVRSLAQQMRHPDGCWQMLSAEDFLRLCPYGEPGDRLWVRETWSPVDFLAHGVEREEPVCIGYRADEAAICHEDGNRHTLDTTAWGWDLVRWRPSIHMPRWASRITLEVTDVRVQRLQDISEEDARAEGLSWWSKDGQLRKWGLAERHTSGELDFVTPWADMAHTAQEAFARLWDGINGKPPGRRERRRAAGEERERNRVLGSWASNPWVWAMTFRVIRS